MAAQNAAGLIFSIIVVLVLVVLVYAVFRLFCSATSRLVGYWSSPDGSLFEISRRAGNGSHDEEYVVSTASGILGAASGERYPVSRRGCRSVSVAFPHGALQGRIGINRRRVIWNRAPAWHRQGV